MEKKIDHILLGREKSIGEETILQPLPHKDFRFANPFIVLHHLPEHQYAPNSPAERVHPHPHRGFSPVTFMFQGSGYHKDNQGNEGEINTGDVQWMFAGSGLLHSEGPTKEFLEKGGSYEFIQLWVNVPKAHKWDAPNYQQVSANQMPSLFNEEGINLKLASGDYGNFSGPLKSFTPVVSFFGSIANGKTLKLAAKEGYWTLLYFLKGAANVNGSHVKSHELIIFEKENTDIQIATEADCKIIFLSAEPINEPVAAKGNIVMNTEEEVLQAEQDYADGKFGTLDY
jgi:redox-sensitive bicupin YhaK (pirin superfamily)